MYGRGICPCHHNFCGSSPFSFNFAAERIAGIAIKAEIPIETVRVYDDLGDEGLDHRFGHILSFVGIGVLLQSVLQDCQLLPIVHHFLGPVCGGQLVDFLLQILDYRLQFRALTAEQLPADAALGSRGSEFRWKICG